MRNRRIDERPHLGLLPGRNGVSSGNPARDVVECFRGVDKPHILDYRMVRQVTTDRRVVDDGLYPDGGQVRCITDTGEKEDLRGSNRAGRQDNLFQGMDDGAWPWTSSQRKT